MRCKDCKYNSPTNHSWNGKEMNYCLVTHVLGHSGCIYDDSKIENMKICFNCKHWLGCGDWGLSCKKNYYIATSNGFNEACEHFKRKEQ